MSRTSKLIEKTLSDNSLSRQALARAAVISDSIITKIINNHQKISVENCIRIGLALAISPMVLFNARVADEIDELEKKLDEDYSYIRQLIIGEKNG